MKKLTVTIGIPAYNEEANIAYLLAAILKDKSVSISLRKIIVVSDGSTDETVMRGRSLGSPLIKVVDRKKRVGIAKTQNEIIRRANSDFLIMLDADVMPIQKNFLDKITEPLRKNIKVGCVGADTIPLRPQNIFDRIISNSHYMKRHLYRRISKGNNLYLCHGRARALSRKLYKTIKWPDNCPEDAFSYLKCISMGFKFIYTDKAGVYFRSPLIFSEHELQSSRFIAGREKLQELFSQDFLRKQYAIPRLLSLLVLLRYLIRNPFSTPTYLVIMLYIRFTHKKEKLYRSRFEIASSSKRIMLHYGQKLSRI